MIKEIHSLICRLAKYVLETREVLDDIKIRFSELVELTLSFTPEQKDINLFYVVGMKFKKN